MKEPSKKIFYTTKSVAAAWLPHLQPWGSPTHLGAPIYLRGYSGGLTAGWAPHYQLQGWCCCSPGLWLWWCCCLCQILKIDYHLRRPTSYLYIIYNYIEAIGGKALPSYFLLFHHLSSFLPWAGVGAGVGVVVAAGVVEAVVVAEVELLLPLPLLPPPLPDRLLTTHRKNVRVNYYCIRVLLSIYLTYTHTHTHTSLWYMSMMPTNPGPSSVARLDMPLPRICISCCCEILPNRFWISLSRKLVISEPRAGFGVEPADRCEPGAGGLFINSLILRTYSSSLSDLGSCDMWYQGEKNISLNKLFGVTV